MLHRQWYAAISTQPRWFSCFDTIFSVFLHKVCSSSRVGVRVLNQPEQEGPIPCCRMETARCRWRCRPKFRSIRSVQAAVRLILLVNCSFVLPSVGSRSFFISGPTIWNARTTLEILLSLLMSSNAILKLFCLLSINITIERIRNFLCRCALRYIGWLLVDWLINWFLWPQR